MSEADRQRWQQRHREPREAPPRPTVGWLGRSRGVALDVACGQGRHTLALLELGYHVVGVDIARTALERLRARLPREAPVLLVEGDLDMWPFARDALDVVVMIDFLDRSVIEHVRSSVRPGGRVLVDTFLYDPAAPTTKGPSNPDYRLRIGELDEMFADWTVLERATFPGDGPRDAILARRP